MELFGYFKDCIVFNFITIIGLFKEWQIDGAKKLQKYTTEHSCELLRTCVTLIVG